VLADNSEPDVYLCGSGAVVYVFKKGGAGGGDVIRGDVVCADDAGDSGYVIPLYKYTASDVATTQLKALQAVVGRAMETLASEASGGPLKVMLNY
jgi:hypothetical protein